ncbi:copper-binding protein [Rhodoferax saidenbachensis]|uniref:copper-binding protein n=1 Tax=Rhodoferax saidenbachensis TaxID=1484693 RepID=UPI0004B13754|nr:copper-binding protein [Rhodoferax saidenbachensis]
MKHWIFATALVCAGTAWADVEWVRGRVVKVEPDKARITLQHARIKSIRMEAMTMPFKVIQPERLQGLKVGQKVRFTVAMQDDHLMVDALEPVQ